MVPIIKQFSCEICQGTEIIKQEGAFVCQKCGCKYSLHEVKKILENKDNNDTGDNGTILEKETEKLDIIEMSESPNAQNLNDFLLQEDNSIKPLKKKKKIIFLIIPIIIAIVVAIIGFVVIKFQGKIFKNQKDSTIDDIVSDESIQQDDKYFEEHPTLPTPERFFGNYINKEESTVDGIGVTLYKYNVFNYVDIKNVEDQEKDAMISGMANYVELLFEKGFYVEDAKSETHPYFYGIYEYGELAGAVEFEFSYGAANAYVYVVEG